MYPIHDFSDAAVAFPASVLNYMPRREEIPGEFGFTRGHKYVKFFTDKFYSGLEYVQFFPREGVDSEMAQRHLQCIAASFEPKHEHKEEAFAYLCDQWFTDIKWKARKRNL